MEERRVPDKHAGDALPKLKEECSSLPIMIGPSERPRLPASFSDAERVCVP